MKKSVCSLPAVVLAFTLRHAQNETLVSVNLNKMNVIYAGVENPVEINVCGIPYDKILATISEGCTIEKNEGENNRYIIKVKETFVGKAVVSVFLKYKTDSLKQIGEFTFRVKLIPVPIIYFAGKSGIQTIPKSQLQAALGVVAMLNNFDFDCKYNIVSYDLTLIHNGEYVTETNNSNGLSDKQKELIKKAVTGDIVLIENVKAKSSFGNIVECIGVTLKVN